MILANEITSQQRSVYAEEMLANEITSQQRSVYAEEMWANGISSQLRSIHAAEVDKRELFQTLFKDHILCSLFPGLEDIPPPFATQAPEPFHTKLPKWANGISSQLRSIHAAEVDKRELFQTLFKDHILCSLFPGLEDIPPPFATQAPEPFHTKLPKWANGISSQLRSIHAAEVDKRELFQTLFKDHILCSLFPGLEDIPPPFATQAPEPFHTKLPKYRRMRLKSCKDCQGLSALDWCKSMSAPWQRKGNAGRASCTLLLRYRTLRSSGPMKSPVNYAQFIQMKLSNVRTA
ncbi:reticulophagy [Homalodisca vitripennis]|nr:reticulophagy [Homalodisca vitripennis]